jgi:hypothetical protein
LPYRLPVARSAAAMRVAEWEMIPSASRRVSRRGWRPAQNAAII